MLVDVTDKCKKKKILKKTLIFELGFTEGGEEQAKEPGPKSVIAVLALLVGKSFPWAYLMFRHAIITQASTR